MRLTTSLFRRHLGESLVFKRLADLSDQRVAREWLQQDDRFLENFPAASVLLQIAGHVYDSQARKTGFQLLGKLRSSHSGHHHIRQKELNRTTKAIRNLECFHAVPGREHTITGRP